jgi:predicted membrane channel-forming protein YqfA (hemolysin III family)
MSYEEKNAWVFGVVTVVSYLAYCVIILTRAQGAPLADVSYAWTMVATIAAAIFANIVLMIILSVATRDRAQKDERDKEIGRRGDHIGQAFVVIGAVSALIMAMLELEYFWIANVIYLCFVLSAVVSSTAKLVAYRRGFQGW